MCYHLGRCSCNYSTLPPFLPRDSQQFYMELQLNGHRGGENVCFNSACLGATALVMQITKGSSEWAEQEREHAITDRENWAGKATFPFKW